MKYVETPITNEMATVTATAIPNPVEFKQPCNATTRVRNSQRQSIFVDEDTRAPPPQIRRRRSDSPLAGGDTVVGQAKPHTLNMQQLSGVGIGCPAKSSKTPFRVALAKHSAETCVVGAVVNNNSARRRALLMYTDAGDGWRPIDVAMMLVPKRSQIRRKSRGDWSQAPVFLGHRSERGPGWVGGRCGQALWLSMEV
jgi:hypothetical protein